MADSPLDLPSDESSPSPPSSPGLNTPPNLHQNVSDPSAKWLVLKFGGTSVGKFADQIAEVVIPQYLDQHKLAIVCSARSGTTKKLGTTNLLIKAAEQAVPCRRSSGGVGGRATPGTMTPLQNIWTSTKSASLPSLNAIANSNASPNTKGSPPPSPSRKRQNSAGSGLNGLLLTNLSKNKEEEQTFVETVDLIKQEHLEAAKNLIRDDEILLDLEEDIEQECEMLKAFLMAVQVIDEISPRSRDSIIGVGEKLACKLMTALLRDRGIDAEYVSLENIAPPLDSVYDESSHTSSGSGSGSGEGTLPQEWYDSLGQIVAERILACEDRVPVVTGFFSPVPGSLLSTVGRGYTDLLASLLSAGLAASELQIWKEVDGIFTADPNKVPTARLLPTITPEEAAELTFFGSEVVHPFTMEQVMRRDIPIRIKNVKNPQGGGTVILPNPNLNNLSRMEGGGGGGGGQVATKEKAPHAYVEQKSRTPTAVTYKDNITVLNINSNRKSVSHGFLAGIFAILDRFGVGVDLISTSEVHVSMAMQMQMEDTAGSIGSKSKLERIVRELKKYGTVSVLHDMAILSLVGSQMQHLIGISGLFFSTLGNGKINIEMISQGASEINISCVIKGRDAVKALNLVHQSCLQVTAEGTRGRVGPWLF